MRRPASFAVDPGVFWVSLVISLLFVAWGVFFTDNLATVAGAALDFVIANFGWVFILASFGFLAFVVFLAFSRYGRIRLGNDDDRPEFRTVSWVAMMFSAAFVISAVTGVHRGIQWLANTNMVLAIFLLLFVFVLGPTVFILNTFVESLGGYIARLVPMSFRSGAFSDDSWLASWTIFYWAWWISWTPFVGTFIARISRGRTIREFVIGVLLVPSVVSFIWFAILGGAAVNLELAGVGNISEAVNRGLENALFSTLNEFPLAWLTSLIAIILVAIFLSAGRTRLRW